MENKIQKIAKKLLRVFGITQLIAIILLLTACPLVWIWVSFNLFLKIALTLAFIIIVMNGLYKLIIKELAKQSKKEKENDTNS